MPRRLVNTIRSRLAFKPDPTGPDWVVQVWGKVYRKEVLDAWHDATLPRSLQGTSRVWQQDQQWVFKDRDCRLYNKQTGDVIMTALL